MGQVKNSFDKETVRKIWKGALLALSGPAGVAIMNLASQAPKSAWWGVVIAYGVPVIVNTIREYIKGVEQDA